MTVLEGQHIAGLVGLAIPALVARDTMGRVARHTKSQGDLSIVDQAAPLTMAMVVRHIQVQAVPASLVRAVLVIRGQVGQVKIVLRYADDT